MEKKMNTKKNFNKNKKQKKNVSVTLTLDSVGPFYEYSMSKEAVKDILRDRIGADAKKHPQTYLCEYVTEQYGLKGTCIKVYGV